MGNEILVAPSEKKYHLDRRYLDEPKYFGNISLIQIGRLHCTARTVVGLHTHQNWFEITVVTDGAGTVVTGNDEVAVKRGDIHLSYPGDFHAVRTDPTDPLKYDFFAFYTTETRVLDMLEEIMRVRQSGDRRIVRDERIGNLLENAIAEISQPSEFSNDILEPVFRQIVFYLIRDFRADNSQKKMAVGTPEALCYQVMHYVDTHIYTMNALFEIADALNYNYSYLSDLFKTVTGDTIQSYYQTRRLRAAQLLLCENNLKLGEIATLLRYSSIYAFSRAFKDHFGVSPSNFRKSPMIEE